MILVGLNIIGGLSTDDPPFEVLMRSTEFSNLGYKAFSFAAHNPISGEKYDFEVRTSLIQWKADKQSHAFVTLDCWRGTEKSEMITYKIEPMNNFSLFAFISQYQESLINWLLCTTAEDKIREAMRSFQKRTPLTIKVNGTTVKSLGIEIVEVSE